MQFRRLLAVAAMVVALLSAGGQPVFGAASPSPSPTPSPAAVPRGPRSYLLPFSGGTSFEVCQGNNHVGGTHTDVAAYAWDFCMPVGTPVVAARGGTVRAVRQDSNTGGWGAQFADDANFVVIDHGDGTSGLYMHLMLRGARVKVGDQVQTGQLIAYSGNTGWSSAPHLHFMAMQTEADNDYSQSLPVLFSDVSADGGLPLEDHTYASGNAKLDPRLFSPTGPPPFTPFWVETFHDSTLWSGTDDKAVNFGPAAPWQFFQVVAPQTGPRLQVVVAATGVPAFIPAADVGPTGPPPSVQPQASQAAPGPLGSPQSATAPRTPSAPAAAAQVAQPSTEPGAPAVLMAEGTSGAQGTAASQAGQRAQAQARGAAGAPGAQAQGSPGAASPQPSAAASEPSSSPAVASPAASGEAKAGTVTVAAGDTLYSLAKAHQLTVDKLVAINQLADPNHLALGQVLKLS